MKTCYLCGSRLEFRPWRRMPDGSIIRYKRPYPIHVDHPCIR